MSYPIFPSITRAPKYESTRSLEDGTIADPMESGYVATRPRFTRQRRKFGVTYKNICGEDIRVLDQFEVETVVGKAGAFYYPNLLPNGSFEIPAVAGWGQLAFGWTVRASTYFSSSLSASAFDGNVSLLLASQATTVPVGGYGGVDISGVMSTSFPVSVGDVYQFTGQIKQTNTNPAGVNLSVIVVLQVTYADGTTGYAQYYVQVPAEGWTPLVASLTVPTAALGSPAAVSAVVGLGAWLGNTTSAAVVVPAGASLLYIDQVGLALTTPAQPYGRMPGSQPLGSLVRFTKQPSIRDNTFAGGQPTYDCTFEITEV